MNDKSQVIINGSVCDSVDYEKGIATIECGIELPEPRFAVRDDVWAANGRQEM